MQQLFHISSVLSSSSSSSPCPQTTSPPWLHQQQPHYLFLPTWVDFHVMCHISAKLGTFLFLSLLHTILWSCKCTVSVFLPPRASQSLPHTKPGDSRQSQRLRKQNHLARACTPRVRAQEPQWPPHALVGLVQLCPITPESSLLCPHQLPPPPGITATCSACYI